MPPFNPLRLLARSHILTVPRAKVPAPKSHHDLVSPRQGRETLSYQLLRHNSASSRHAIHIKAHHIESRLTNTNSRFQSSPRLQNDCISPRSEVPSSISDSSELVARIASCLHILEHMQEDIHKINRQSDRNVAAFEYGFISTMVVGLAMLSWAYREAKERKTNGADGRAADTEVQTLGWLFFWGIEGLQSV